MNAVSLLRYSFASLGTPAIPGPVSDLLPRWVDTSHLWGPRKLDAQAILTKSHYRNVVRAKGLLPYIVNPCDLPWHDDCLRFEENTSPVATVGSVQACSPTPMIQLPAGES